MIKAFLLVCLWSLAACDVAKPLLRPLPIAPVIPPVAADPFYPYRGEPSAYGGKFSILSYENDIRPDGSYRYAYETENGIAAEEEGVIHAVGTDTPVVVSGVYSYTSPEGLPVQVSYIADENGFQPTGNVLPSSPNAILGAREGILGKGLLGREPLLRRDPLLRTSPLLRPLGIAPKTIE